MDYQSLAKLVSNRYGLRFVAIPNHNEGEPTQSLSLKIGAAPFIVLNDEEPVRVDAKCFSFADAIRDLPGFRAPFFHRDKQWVGFDLSIVGDRAIINIVDYAFKAAMNAGQAALQQQQYVILPEKDSDDHYQAQAIPQSGTRRIAPRQKPVPKEIAAARAAYDYTLLPGERRDKNFYRQGLILANYTDDCTELVPLKRYFPTYHDLSMAQLRTYFTWRAKLRQGEVVKVSDSYAYLYIYELLNNIGVDSPTAGFQALTAFRDQYANQFSSRMGSYLDRWLQDYVLYYRLDHDLANRVFADEIAADHDYHVLLHPADYDAADLVAVFQRHATYLKNSRLYQKSTAHFAALLKAIWQAVLDLPDQTGTKYFNHHVASQQMMTNYLFGNAVFYFRPQHQMAEYPVDSVRQYRFKGRQYYCLAFKALPNERQNLNAFLHEVDRLVRQRFNLGHPLKPRWVPEDVLAAIDQGIREYQHQLKEARRPKVHIDLGDIDQIRQDAAVTQASLLTDEERQAIAEDQATNEEVSSSSAEATVKAAQASAQPVTRKLLSDTPDQSAVPAKSGQAESAAGDQPQPAVDTATADSAAVPDLNADERYLLTALLTGQPWADYLKKRHLMVSILADQINADLFDVIGDDVIEFDKDDRPGVIADYRPDLEDMFSDKE